MAYTRSRTRIPQRIIVTDDDVRDGVRALRRRCAVMRRVHDLAGHPPLRRRPAGFEGLARIIVGQQVSVASATAIWERTAAACVPFEPATLLALSDKGLAGAGLSRPKIRTLRAIAAACAGGLDLTRLDDRSDQEIHDALTAITGIGPWTADVYLTMALLRPDAFPHGDLALVASAQRVKRLDARPSPLELEQLAEAWRPHRAAAARILWHAYLSERAKPLPARPPPTPPVRAA